MTVEPALLPALRQAILSMSNEVSTTANPLVQKAVGSNGYLKDMEKMDQLVKARIDTNKEVTVLLN
jgi:hypothetical protein